LYYGAYKSLKTEETLNVLNTFLNSFKEVGFNGKVPEICGKIRADLDKRGTPIGPYDLTLYVLTG